jgi:hypothetical protein
MFKSVLLMFGALLLSQASLANTCATDDLQPLVGRFTGAASIVTAEENKFELRRPKTLAPTTIKNRSVFSLEQNDPCAQFTITIDYLKPELVGKLTGNSLARRVSFNGVAEIDGTFSLYANNVKKGQLKKIDDETFFASFFAPNPLNPNEQTFCKEFISFNRSKTEVVRTLQCFDTTRERLIQYRLVKEKKIN